MDDIGARKADHLLRKGISQLGITLTEQSIDRLVQYSLELLKWNRKINLVAKKTSLEDVVEKHFLDSLTLLPVLEKYVPANGEILDIGSGAGFPGLVIKAACPMRSLTLMEPRLRRVSFLNHIIRLLALQGVEVIPHRSDEQDVLTEAHFAVVTGRAVADVTTFLSMVDDLSYSDTFIVCMQGSSGKDQWVSEKDNPRFDRVGLEHIRLPFSLAHRTILVFRKKS